MQTTDTSMDMTIAKTVRWSEAKQWLGYEPSAGDDVIIPPGLEVILDGSTPELGTLAVNGKLVFDNKDITLTADNIIVNGELRAGTEQNPHEYKANIILTGKEADADIVVADWMDPNHSSGEHDHHINEAIDNKALIVSGKLELHGAKKDSWEQLDGTLQKGATSLQLADVPTGWNKGDTLVIAPTDFDAWEREEVKITAISGRTVTFDKPLKHLHYGEKEILADGRILDMRAEVANITRNISITGLDEGEVFEGKAGRFSNPEQDSQRWGYGGHTMYLKGSEIHVDGVEFEGLGITGKPGRYPTHFHHGGDQKGSYIKNSSVHNTLQRGIVIHQTNEVLIEGNIVYDTVGHQYFLEDGIEVDNKFHNNLGILPRTTPQNLRLDLIGVKPDSNFNIDRLKRLDRASTFWISNGANEFIGNHAAGVPRGQGFWYTFPDTNIDFEAQGIDPKIYTDRPSQTFKDNTAHTIAFEQTGGSNLNYGPEWTGIGLDFTTVRSDSQGKYAGIKNADIENFTAYKTGNMGINVGRFKSKIIDPILAESRSLLHVPQGFNGSSPVQVINPALIGETDNNPVDRNVVDYLNDLIKKGHPGPQVAEPLGNRGIAIEGGFISDLDDFESLLGTKEKHFHTIEFLEGKTGRTALDPINSVSENEAPPAPVPSDPIDPVSLPDNKDIDDREPLTVDSDKDSDIQPPPVVNNDQDDTDPSPPVVEYDNGNTDNEPPVSTATGDPITLKAPTASLGGDSSAQSWGEDGVTVQGFDANGSAAVVNYGWDGLAVEGNRYDNQIDYDIASGNSEKLVIDFNGAVNQTSIELGRMSPNEWNGLQETGVWKTYAANGDLISRGNLDPLKAQRTGKDSYSFEIATAKAFDQLSIEATAYGNGARNDRSDNNSDFNLRTLTYSRVGDSSPTSPSTTPPTTTPPSTESPTTPVEPPTTPSDLGARINLTASPNILGGSALPQQWGDSVKILGQDFDGSAAEIVYDDRFKDEGFGVAGTDDRWSQIDFYANKGNKSESVKLYFDTLVDDVVLTLGMLGKDEGGTGYDETGKWTAYNAQGAKVGDGLLGPELSALGKDQKLSDSYGKYPIAIDAGTPFSELVIEATGFGHGTGEPTQKRYGENNSDFNIAALSFAPIPGTEGAF